MRRKTKLSTLRGDLARHMRDRRRSLGLTQEQLAERSGLSTNFIARLEIADKTPSVSTLIALADALGVDVAELLARESPSPGIESAKEVARLMESLSSEDARFVLNQVQAVVSHLQGRSVR